MTRAIVVINPLSGSGRYDNQIQEHARLAREVLAAGGLDAEIRTTTGSGDAHRFAAEAVESRCDLVVVWGGDGTVNEAASALVHTPVPLAIVPAGSGNGLAADLGVPFAPRQALELAAARRTKLIDAGQAGDSYFFNIAGIGIDAVIAARFAERGLRRRGPVAYLQLSTTELVRYRAKRYELTLDGTPRTHDAMLVAVANGRQYGNRVLIAPGARLDDGLLEVVIVEQLSMWGIASRLPALFRGTLRGGPGLTMQAARTIEVRSEGDIPYHVDGEPRVARDSLEIRTHPGALHVCAPRLGP